MLEVQVVKRRRDFSIDVAFRLEPGARLGLFGGSGEGKSTVLSCIAGLESPDAGCIVFQGTTLFPPSLPLHQRGVGYLTQKNLLFPHLSVAENVQFSLDGRTRIAEQAWIGELQERLGLGVFWRASARRLSGGQARRVALARMLARKPRLVLLDEPFAGLDRHITTELVEMITGWQRELGFTLVAVDHQPEVLARLCPAVIAIERGRIIQQGCWDQLVSAPATPLLARLLAGTNR